MISRDTSWENQLPTPYCSTKQGKKKEKKAQNLSFSRQEIEIIGNVLMNTQIFLHIILNGGTSKSFCEQSCYLERVLCF